MAFNPMLGYIHDHSFPHLKLELYSSGSHPVIKNSNLVWSRPQPQRKVQGVILHSLGKHFIQPGDLARHAQVDGSLADLDDEAAQNVRVDF